MKTATQIEQGPLAYPVRNAKGIDQAVAVVLLAIIGGARFGATDEHADTLAGGMAAVNSNK